MRYLIFQQGQAPFFTAYYTPENVFADGMTVVDLQNSRYTTDGHTWLEIEVDHL